MYEAHAGTAPECLGERLRRNPKNPPPQAVCPANFWLCGPTENMAASNQRADDEREGQTNDQPARAAPFEEIAADLIERVDADATQFCETCEAWTAHFEQEDGRYLCICERDL